MLRRSRKSKRQNWSIRKRSRNISERSNVLKERARAQKIHNLNKRREFSEKQK